MMLSIRRQFNIQAILKKVDTKANDKDVMIVFKVQDEKILSVKNEFLSL